MNKFSLFLARQRSGTGALGSVLDKHPELKYLGEIFHPANVGQPDNYFTFLLDFVAKDPQRALPDANEQNLLEYLELIQSRYPGQFLIIDVKYRSLHHLLGGWNGLNEMPWLIRYARSNRMPIIHLTRRNFVESFVSGRLAEANKVWHTSDQGAAKIKSTPINIRQLSAYIQGISEEVALIERWTETYGVLVKTDYADMFDRAGHITEAVANNISRAFQIGPFVDRAPSFVKQAPSSVTESIENIELVRTALAGTEHEWMVR